MATTIFKGVLPAIAQVDKFTPANVEATDDFTLTATGDDGSTVAITFTATAGTVANVTAGLTAAWNASGHPLCAALTATDVTTYMTLTADAAGRPFSVASTTTDHGGANTQTLTRAAVTASSGPNDWGLAGNFSGLAVPVGTNNVIIPAGAPSILYGLNQSAVTLAALTIEDGYTGNIGRNEGLVQYALRVACTSLTYSGTGTLARFDVGASAIAPTIYSSGNPGTGAHGVEIKGTALTTVNVLGGNVGVGTLDGDATTVVANLVMNGDAQVEVGVGDASDMTAITKNGGTLTLRRNCPTVTNYAGDFYLFGTSTIATKLYNYGRAFLQGTGTVALAVGSGTFDKSTSASAQTITELDQYSKSTLNDPQRKLTITTHKLVGCGLGDVVINRGKDITVTS